jgi:Ni/Fe-hydrogenase subunit HybB-like protein
MPYLIGIYLVLRVGDVLVRGEVFRATTLSGTAVWWWLEILLLLGALVLYLMPARTGSRSPIVLPSVLTVGALVAHRVGVSVVGLLVPGVSRYIPAVTELLITVGVFALGLLAFRLAAEYLPIYGVDQARIWALAETPACGAPEGQQQSVPQVAPA